MCGSLCRFKITKGDHIADACEALSGYLSGKRHFTAVVCFNDLVAVGVYKALYMAGLKVPQDVSVIGFDDNHCEFTCPPLTTVDHMLFEMGQRGVSLLLEMTRDEKAISSLCGCRQLITPRLVIRESTAPPRDFR